MYNDYKIISLCISKAGDERIFEFVNAFNDAAKNSGFILFIYQTCSDLYWKTRSENGDKTVFKLIDFDVSDAVVIFDEAFQDKTVVDEITAAAACHNVPVVMVGAVRENCTSFIFDYAAGFEQVVRHVIEYHSVTDTCFIAGRKDELCSDQRIAAYKKVLEDNSIDFRPDRLFYGDYWWGPTQKAVQSIVQSGEIPKAFICANDMMAITVCKELKKYGYSVPEDIIVTGFDGTISALSCVPPITTCKCSFPLAAEKIIGVINRLIVGESCAECYNIDFEVKIYRSCGCPCDAPPINMGERLKAAEDRFIRYQDDERSLNDITQSIVGSDSPQAFSEYLRNYNFYDLCIVLNNDCLDKRINPAVCERVQAFDDVMQVFFAADQNGDTDTALYPMPRKNIVPDIDRLLKKEVPLVFAALSFLGIPMGFVCFSFEVDIEQYCKILQYVSYLNTTIGNYRLVRFLKHTAENVENMSKYDFMTGLCNRKGFYKTLPQLVSEADENDHISVATIDIDGLKNINDKFGHEDGDFAIMSVSAAVNSLPFERKICARFGGDELVICAVTETENAERIFTDSIRKYLDEVNKASGKPFKVSASVGVFTAKASEFDFEYSLKQSDDKMYIMKIGRPNRRKS
ncbi:MAG: GGDEF domain-containing protein [Huintestinicola sp.]